MEDIEVYELILDTIHEDYMNGIISFEEYKKDLFYYSNVLNNHRIKEGK